jgi:hypothetical protein
MQRSKILKLDFSDKITTATKAETTATAEVTKKN